MAGTESVVFMKITRATLPNDEFGETQLLGNSVRGDPTIDEKNVMCPCRHTPKLSWWVEAGPKRGMNLLLGVVSHSRETI